MQQKKIHLGHVELTDADLLEVGDAGGRGQLLLVDAGRVGVRIAPENEMADLWPRNPKIDPF